MGSAKGIKPVKKKRAKKALKENDSKKTEELKVQKELQGLKPDFRASFDNDE